MCRCGRPALVPGRGRGLGWEDRSFVTVVLGSVFKDTTATPAYAEMRCATDSFGATTRRDSRGTTFRGRHENGRGPRFRLFERLGSLAWVTEMIGSPLV